MQRCSPAIINNMRRLYPRGTANLGICVDAEGAVLGPNCALVNPAPGGFRTIERSDAALVQKCLLDEDRGDDWLLQQCQRIADALNKGEITLAQIYGLRIPVRRLSDGQFGPITFAKAGFNPDEPRIPKGNPHGGEWTAESSPDVDQVADAPMNRNKNDCIEYCFGRTAGMRDLGGDPFWACLRACQGKFPNPFFPEFDDHFS